MRPFVQNPANVGPVTNSRLAPLNPEPADYGFGSTVNNAPLDPSTFKRIEVLEFEFPSFFFFFVYSVCSMYM